MEPVTITYRGITFQYARELAEDTHKHYGVDIAQLALTKIDWARDVWGWSGTGEMELIFAKSSENADISITPEFRGTAEA